MTSDAHIVRIYLSGPIEEAKSILRDECLTEPICVTIEPTLYIFTGGEETGYVVGLLNYPRFPAEPKAIDERAIRLAKRLMLDTHQRSALVVMPEMTEWLQREGIGPR